jgi:Ca2+-transporting ATPase
MEHFYDKPVNKIYEFYNSKSTGMDAKQIAINLKKYGPNEIVEKEPKSKARVFLEQFEDFLVIILILSAFISTIIGEIESTIVIFLVIIVNAFLGTSQHFKAEKSLNSLKTLSSPSVKVIRDNNEVIIPSKDLVNGDIVLIRSGDMIAADGRLIEENGLEINESSLNGESQAIIKTHETLTSDNFGITDQTNMVFSGTFCVKGSGRYIVCQTGMKTEIGKIAKLISNTKVRKTPLQNNLDSFSKLLAILIISICFVVFILGIYRNISILDSLMFAVALAVAAIPEALSTIVVIVLAIGTERMTHENAIIKDLKAVEGLGCINVICTDKTGTLTQNKMEVKDLVYECDKQFFMKCLINSCGQNNATEESIINFVKNQGYVETGKKIFELSFTSSRKMMSTLYSIDGLSVMFTKGANDAVLSNVRFIKIKDRVKIIEKSELQKISEDIEKMARNGLRIIVFAYKDLGYVSKIKELDETDLIYVGMVSIIDPLRIESKDAVKDCLKAGIKPVMLTGDHKDTAIYIAKEVGILQNDDMVVTGTELDKMSDSDLNKNVKKISVYARLTPSHKIRIVKAWQKQGAIVAMTGDGINDGPAIRQADIGIAMGKSGTEVAKEASSIILTDDNFATIIKAVSNGRNVYQNIQNAIRFLLSGNFAAILIVVFASVFNLPVPFVAVHLLFINLLTDSLPAIAIGMEDGNNKDLLKKKPRKINEHLLNKRLLLKVAVEGVLIGFFTTYSYFVGLKTSVEVARSMAFATLCLARLFHSFNCVRAKSVLLTGLKNTYLILSVLIGIVLINMVILIPELRNVIVVSKLTTYQIISIYGLSLMPTIILQMRSIIKYAN